ncbi:ABC transporter ATP-binding protein [Roseovarius amoyensis]|uniref:ABC transporter ATP-binding protein n=1 Tax=Roseovarius amoyensis TaxID=2211448 RepID=UPI000DBE1C66|nr:ABC transporter ATP-binding protein [Roseovarius amoyensis]
MSNIVLSAKNLRLTFGAITAVDDISLHVKKGQISAVIGPNGAGKSSLLNCLSGFYKPSSGMVEFEGEDITNLAPFRRAERGMARTFQGNQTYQSMTVRENILSGFHNQMSSGLLGGLLYWGRVQKENAHFINLAEEIIEFLELEQLRNTIVGELGYGLRKRIDLGRALGLNPKILIMDEPMAGMNTEEKGDLARFILDIRDARNIPVILVEHDMEVVMDISDEVTVIDWGKVISSGAPDAVRNDPKVISAYLGGDVA